MRKALVIGNRYALEMKAGLEKCRFRVFLHTDLKRNDMYDARDSFIQEKDSNDVVVFYFSGRGVEYKGEQFLIPCEMEDPKSESQLKFQTMSVDEVIKNIAKKCNNGLKIIICDSCRSEYNKVLKDISSRVGNVFSSVHSNYHPDEEKQQGISKAIDVCIEKVSIVRMNAASRGETADGGARTNLSSYTKALTENLLIPDQSLLELKIKMDNVLLDCDANAEITFGNSEEIVATFRYIEKN